MCQPQRPHFARFACKTLFLALLPLTAFLAIGCGRNNETENNTPAPSGGNKSPAVGTGSGGSGGGSGDFKVALVTSGPISDNGWNAGAYKALEAVRAELHLSKEDSPNVESASTPGKREENLRDFARRGYQIVFGHGNEYEDLALKMEKEFPKTLFVISSGRKVGVNTMPIVLHLEDGAYLLGMLAAGVTKTNKVACVGAEKIVPVQSVFAAFEAGVKAVKPEVQVIPPVYTGSWDDVGKAKEQTLALINQGADVIMQDVDAAAQGVFNAVQESKAKGVYALGTNSDQNSAAPDVVLASAPIYQEKAFVAIAKAAKAGGLKPSDKPYGMPEGVIDFVLNPQLESKIPAELKTKLTETKKKIADGSLTVPKGNL